MPIVGKVVIVTGASSGIGEAIAKGFAKAGCRLCITARNEKKLKKVAQDCKDLGAETVKEVIADLSVENDVKKILRVAIAAYGKLDVLVNNAGLAIPGGTTEGDLKDLDMMYKVNVRAVVQLSKLAITYLKQTKGSIVNTSSCTTTNLSPDMSFYSMTKSAIDYHTKCSAMDLASSGVRVNAVNPGAVLTDTITSLPQKDMEGFVAMGKRQPLGRLVEASEIADTVLFLASEQAAMITGSCICVDGGLSLHSLFTLR